MIRLNDPTDRRLAYFEFNPEFVVGLCKDERPFILQCVENLIPKDANIVGIEVVNYRIRLILESVTFQPVYPGEAIVRLPDTVFTSEVVKCQES